MGRKPSSGLRPPSPALPREKARLALAQRQLGEGARRAGEGVWRLLDANANRAREGLRIIEDSARFVLDKPAAAMAIRGLRHGVDELVRKHYKQLLSARDVEHDSGRANAAEPYTGGIRTLLAANFKRVEEALRVLEEYGRLLSPSAVRKAQALRFDVYRWEKQL